MRPIKREKYLQKLINVMWTPNIKLITGSEFKIFDITIKRSKCEKNSLLL